MLLIIETGHTVEIHTIEYITVDTTTGQGLMKYKNIVSAAQTAQTCQNVKNKSILKHLTTQKLVSPSQNSSNLPVTLRGPEHCLTENRQHASQTGAD